VDSDFSWPLLVNSRRHFLSTRILLLGCIFVDIFLVNSSVHFLMVITNSANAGDAGVKPLLDSVNTVQCQVRGCGCKVPARFSKHCSVSRLV
jgi:hypothetical protein